MQYMVVLVAGAIIIALIATLGPSLASALSGSSRTLFGRYDGAPIEHYPDNYFDRQIRALYQQQRQATGLTGAQLEAIIQQAFFQSAFRVAALVNTSEAGVVLSDTYIDNELARRGPYTVDGVLDERRYRDTPINERRSNRELFHDQLLQEQYGIDLTSVVTGSRELAFMTAMVDEERRFRVASFVYENLPTERLRQFGEENASLFRRIRVSRIVLRGTEADAEEVWRRLAEREATFEELMAESSVVDTTDDAAAEPPWTYFYDMELDFDDSAPAERVFALPAGELSGLLATRFGFVIYRVDESAVGSDFAAAATLDEVQAYLAQYQRGLIRDYYSDRAQAFSDRAAEVGFGTAALALGVETVETNFFPINFRNEIATSRAEAINSPSLQGAVFFDQFFEDAFSLDLGETSGPITLDDRVLVLNLLETRSSDPGSADAMQRWYAGSFTPSAIFTDLQALVLESDRMQNFFAEAVQRIQLGRPTQNQVPTQAAF